jgi:hypothetical protein
MVASIIMNSLSASAAIVDSLYFAIGVADLRGGAPLRFDELLRL